MHDVRRVLKQQPSFLERLHHQRDVALLQIADASVHQLGGAARCAFAKVLAFHQQHVEATCGCIDGYTRAGGASADDDDVPGSGVLLHFRNHLFAIHATSLFQPFARSTAFCHFVYSFCAFARSIWGWNTCPCGRVFAISSTLPQKPVASPARYAAPCAVVSRTAGRSTGIPKRSAWNCINKSS